MEKNEMVGKESVQRKRRAFKRKDYPAKNLAFMVEFFRKMGFTLKDYEDAGGTTAVGLGQLLSKDDMKLSKAQDVLSTLGYNLEVRFEEKEKPATTVEYEDSYTVSLPKAHPRNKGKKSNSVVRLAFLDEMMREKNISKTELVQRMGLSIGSIVGWYNKDDIFISYLVKIKDIYDLRIHYIITEK